VADTAKQMLSERVYRALRDAIMRGDFAPEAALKPQELAERHAVSLAVVREALVRLVGDGIVDRLPNRGFAMPAFSDRRWQEIAQARRAVEPGMLRMAVEHGDLDWEARVRAAHHRLSRTPAYLPDEGPQVNPAWSSAHREFHRTLLDGCGNAVLLDVFDRLWAAGELARLWSAGRAPERDALGEHRGLEEAALARDPDRAAALLDRHLTVTAVGLTLT
jgi:DNA-binding GntR family transcriptional regulator